jgi:hypothetical protein
MSRELQILNEVMSTRTGKEDLESIMAEEYVDYLDKLEDVQRTLRRDYKIWITLAEAEGILDLYLLNYA